MPLEFPPEFQHWSRDKFGLTQFINSCEGLSYWYLEHLVSRLEKVWNFTNVSIGPKMCHFPGIIWGKYDLNLEKSCLYPELPGNFQSLIRFCRKRGIIKLCRHQSPTSLRWISPLNCLNYVGPYCQADDFFHTFPVRTVGSWLRISDGA